MAEERGIDKVAAAAERLGLDIEIKTMDRSTRTAAEAAAACGCDVAQIVKSIVFAKGDGFALVLVSGAQNVDLGYVRNVHHLPLERTNAEKAHEATGFAIGGVSPIGSVNELPVLMDETLMGFDTVWCAAGRPDAVFSIAPKTLAEATSATVMPLVDPVAKHH